MSDEVASPPPKEAPSSNTADSAAADGGEAKDNSDKGKGGGAGRGRGGRGGRGGGGSRGKGNRGRNNNNNQDSGDKDVTKETETPADAGGNEGGGSPRKEGGGSPRRRRRNNNNNNNRNRKAGNKGSDDKGADETTAEVKESGDGEDAKEADKGSNNNARRNNNRNRGRNNNNNNSNNRNKDKGKAANPDDLMTELEETKKKLKESERMEILYKKRYAQLNEKWRDLKGVDYENCIVVAVPKTGEGTTEATETTTPPTTDAEKIPVLEQHIANIELELGKSKADLLSANQKLEQAERIAAKNKEQYSKLNEKWRALKAGEKKDNTNAKKGEKTEVGKPGEQEGTVVEEIINADKEGQEKPTEKEAVVAVGSGNAEETPDEDKGARPEVAAAPGSADVEETFDA